MAGTPGTISRILWHFTGGPRWSEGENRQETEPKPTEDAYKALIGILTSRELRIGQYKEVFRAPVPGPFTLRIVSAQIDDAVLEREYFPKTLESSPVCCLADIPIIHLHYHAHRYGKIAIGFHRDAAIQHGFSPVLYQRYNSGIAKRTYECISNIQEVHRYRLTEGLEQSLAAVQNKVGSLPEEVSSALEELSASLSYSEFLLEMPKDALMHVLAYVKTFDNSEFATIFAEREWRSVKPFNFQFDDVSMIVLPRNPGKGDHFKRFVKEAETIGLPKTVSVLAWDDLVEY